MEAEHQNACTELYNCGLKPEVAQHIVASIDDGDGLKIIAADAPQFLCGYWKANRKEVVCRPGNCSNGLMLAGALRDLGFRDRVVEIGVIPGSGRPYYCQPVLYWIRLIMVNLSRDAKQGSFPESW